MGVFLFVSTLFACGSAPATLEHAQNAFQAAENIDVRDDAQTCMRRWPDTSECAATRVLAATTAAADLARAVNEEEWDRAAELASAFDALVLKLNAAQGVTVPTDALAMVEAWRQWNGETPELFESDATCAGGGCAFTLSSERAHDNAAAKSVVLGARLNPGAPALEPEAFAETLVHLYTSDPASSATTWLRQRACTVAPRWEGWDTCGTRSLTGLSWEDANDSVRTCAAAASMVPCPEVAARAAKAVDWASKGAAQLDEVAFTEVCASLDDARSAFAAEDPKLAALGVEPAPPLEWWDTFKQESDLGAKYRVLAAIAVAADNKYNSMVPLFDRLTYVIEEGGKGRVVANEVQAATHQLMIGFAGLSTVMDSKRDFTARVVSGYASAQTLPGRYTRAAKALARLERHCGGWTFPDTPAAPGVSVYIPLETEAGVQPPVTLTYHENRRGNRPGASLTFADGYSDLFLNAVCEGYYAWCVRNADNETIGSLRFTWKGERLLIGLKSGPDAATADERTHMEALPGTYRRGE